MEELQKMEECFLAHLPPDCFLSDDDQSTRPSDPSLHSDQSKDKMIDFKKLEICDPDRYQMWQRLQKQKKLNQMQEERFFADLSPDWYQAWQRLQEDREQLQIEEESVFDDLPPDWMEEEEEEGVEAEEEEEEEEEGVEAEEEEEEEEEVVEAEGEEEEETKSVI
ncbi:major centromere autoantigen B [Labrus bergylta]|uniref:major centromere autoantigen B n=1 Tax=Labrus bergylta TaxID=56723 RepID=UPI003313238F